LDIKPESDECVQGPEKSMVNMKQNFGQMYMNRHKKMHEDASEKFLGTTQMDEFNKRQAEANKKKEINRNRLV